MFRFNPITGNLDLVGGEQDELNVKIKWALESIRSFDKVVSVQYSTNDPTEISTIVFSSVDFPDVEMLKTVYYVDESTSRRIDRVEYVSPVLEGISIRKNYNYSALGYRAGFSYEVF
jgi:hypothetical protein